jgi:uncharacterized protein
MKRFFFFILCCGVIQAATAQQTNVVVKSFFEQMGKGNWNNAMQYMAPVLKEKVNAGVLSALWQQIEQMNGKWETLISQKTVREGDRYIVTAENNFERTAVIFSVALDSANRMIGFFINGSKPRQVIQNANETTDTVHTADGDVLYGTLTQPEGQQHPPVVLIIAGSGPTDRNGNSLFVPGPEGFSYQQLAEGLAANGIASLRYDKRGAGQSTQSSKPLSQLTMADFISDAVACIHHLQRNSRFSSVSVIGHSEGGIIGLELAQDNDLKCLIALSTPGETTDKVLLEQLKPVLSDSLYQQSVSILNDLRDGKTPASVPADLKILFNSGNFNYWKSTFRFDPCVLLPNVRIPVLIVGGAADVQVSPAQVTMLQDCKPGTNLVLIEGMTHALKNSNGISPDKKTPLPLSPELVPALVSFLRQ